MVYRRFLTISLSLAFLLTVGACASAAEPGVPALGAPIVTVTPPPTTTPSLTATALPSTVAPEATTQPTTPPTATASPTATLPPTPTPTPLLSPTPTPVPTPTATPTINPTVAAQQAMIADLSEQVLGYATRIDTLAKEVCPSYKRQIANVYIDQANHTANSMVYKFESNPELYQSLEAQIEAYQVLAAELQPIVGKLERLCLKSARPTVAPTLAPEPPAPPKG